MILSSCGLFTLASLGRKCPHEDKITFSHLYQKNNYTPENIDKHISAEIPSSDNLELQQLVIKHMLHGPHTNKSPCFQKDKSICKKNFPKVFRENTILKPDKYPEYRRKTAANILACSNIKYVYSFCMFFQ